MKLKFSIALFFLLFHYIGSAQHILVKNQDELQRANKIAKPGDVIILQNGEWHNVQMILDATGTSVKPITFRAEKPGGVVITGESTLSIGGAYLLIDGLYFTNGFSGKEPVIKFRSNKNQVANHCRVTNTVINDFSNPRRLDENYWVAFYGKNNRLDHSSFFNKKNMGVMLAVILDDERSRENFHSIDHNYFGFRLPLASNTGETIRVGVSEHCEFNSNTQITDNFFEHCDGETEIISIKSGRNVIRNNVFKESQGSVVLRHGDYNLVENNIFLGNNKRGTGGVRVINKGQWVVNNLFYQCRGTGFRAPLAVMNGVPNSPANRYVAVTDAVIANNSFIDCAPMSLAEGSDTERTVAPSRVAFINNLFYNTTDSIIYKAHDDISKIMFAGNVLNKNKNQSMPAGFSTKSLVFNKTVSILFPFTSNYQSTVLLDSLRNAGRNKLSDKLHKEPGFTDINLFKNLLHNAYNNCGAAWYTGKGQPQVKISTSVYCNTAADLIYQLAKHQGKKLTIHLAGTQYVFNQPLVIKGDVILTTKLSTPVRFSFVQPGAGSLFYLKAGNSLHIKNLNLELKGVQSKSFISTDTSGSSNHSQLKMTGSIINRYSGIFFRAAKTSVTDSAIFTGNQFINTRGLLFSSDEESDKKGYYNLEQLTIAQNIFQNHSGQLLTMMRGGNDESTMGPYVKILQNKFDNCQSANSPFIHMYGTQLSEISQNFFNNVNVNGVLIKYEDAVKAQHFYSQNQVINSGKLIENEFVTQK